VYFLLFLIVLQIGARPFQSVASNQFEFFSLLCLETLAILTASAVAMEKENETLGVFIILICLSVLTLGFALMGKQFKALWERRKQSVAAIKENETEMEERNKRISVDLNVEVPTDDPQLDVKMPKTPKKTASQYM
jgi:hypothetical protein